MSRSSLLLKVTRRWSDRDSNARSPLELERGEPFNNDNLIDLWSGGRCMTGLPFRETPAGRG